MSSSPYAYVNLVDAAFFSALAYADIDQTSAIVWGNSKGTSDVNHMAATQLTLAGWTDQTTSLIDAYNNNPNRVGPAIAFHDASEFNAFRVFVSATHQTCAAGELGDRT